MRNLNPPLHLTTFLTVELEQSSGGSLRLVRVLGMVMNPNRDLDNWPRYGRCGEGCGCGDPRGPSPLGGSGANQRGTAIKNKPANLGANHGKAGVNKTS